MTVTKPVTTVYYCKSLKTTGKPLVVTLENGDVVNTNDFSMTNVDIRIKFNNAKGKAKRSGATTVLEITRR